MSLGHFLRFTPSSRISQHISFSINLNSVKSVHTSPQFVNSSKYQKYKDSILSSKFPKIPKKFNKYEIEAKDNPDWTFLSSPVRVDTTRYQRRGSVLSKYYPRQKPADDIDMWKLQLEKKLQWTETSIRLGAIARKKGMTALWDEWGVRQPCTVLQLEDVQVVQIVENKKFVQPHLVSVQIGCSNKTKNISRPLLGHFKAAGVPPKWKLCDFHVTTDAVLPIGHEIKAAHFVPGQYVDLQAPSIGKGFAGVMKRWGFKGMPASHGTSKTHRSAGSTGQNQSPGRVFKGKKMAGRMGGNNVTVSSKVLKIDNALNLIYVKGAVPGPKDQFVRIKDAIKKQGAKCFPQDYLPPPFPTIAPELLETMPRELIAKSGGVDPFLVKES
ncbi:8086_t:CDS:2 [Dentiscutata erythropus]|uniref:Large ribosomal subunit protein uL3m n=1 Tax=Dentiscutata erythropus TaxID=1348616 RepID=A0A9N9A7H7_9GLOM|nr:8086_t:CDS:2 [Dentiscutata erythropus]